MCRLLLLLISLASAISVGTSRPAVPKAGNANDDVEAFVGVVRFVNDWFYERIEYVADTDRLQRLVQRIVSITDSYANDDDASDYGYAEFWFDYEDDDLSTYVNGYRNAPAKK